MQEGLLAFVSKESVNSQRIMNVFTCRMVERLKGGDTSENIFCVYKDPILFNTIMNNIYTSHIIHTIQNL